MENKIKKIEDIATMLISASEDGTMCDEHHKELQNLKIEKGEKECKFCFSANHFFGNCPIHKIINFDVNDCQNCADIKKLVQKFQTHNHTFTCKKKRRTITIKKTEGHGRLDGKTEGPTIANFVECRFNFPQFPLNRTTFIKGIPKDLSKDEVFQRKKDLKKIKKFLIRKTYSESKDESDEFKLFKTQTFFKFLFDVGMFGEKENIENLSLVEKKTGYQRYLNALSASVRGTGAIFIQRDPKDVLTNNFNRRIMDLHKANHDIQIVIDQVSLLYFDIQEIMGFISFSVCLCTICDRISDQK